MSAAGTEGRDRADASRAVADDAPVFVISVAAQLAGMHAQTLRQYDRLGLVTPGRTAGGGRRYSPRDVALLREVQRLSQEDGVNLAGIKRIIDLESQVEALQQRVHELVAELEESEHRRIAAETAMRSGYGRDLVGTDLVPVRRQSTAALVVWRPREPQR
ncbi:MULTISPECIES: heat shock protein transcriptional repressor HspR [unclassified Geodermatophilus]